MSTSHQPPSPGDYQQVPSSSTSQTSSTRSNVCLSPELPSSENNRESSRPSTNLSIPSIDTIALDDFEELKMSTAAPYSKVVFVDVQESYPKDTDLEVRFYVGDVPKSLNYQVGLYKVGWQNIDENIAFQPVPMNEDTDFGEKKLIFVSSSLPNELTEFYQFVFHGDDNAIHGASTPFCFYHPLDEELVKLSSEMNRITMTEEAVCTESLDQASASPANSEDDFVVVKTQQALLQERLQQLVSDNGVLAYSKQSLEQQILKLKQELAEYKKLAHGTEMVIQQLKSQLTSSEDKAKTGSDEIKKIKDENRSLNELLEKRDADLMLLNQRTIEQEQLVADLKSKMAMIDADVECKQATLAKIMSERRDMETENKLLRCELDDWKAKCDSLESSKDLMMKEIMEQEKLKLRSKVDLKEAEEAKLCLDQQLHEALNHQHSLEEVRQRLETEKTRIENEKIQIANEKKVLEEEKLILMTQIDLARIDREKEMANKDKEWQKKLDEMSLRLVSAAQEYQIMAKKNKKYKDKMERVKAKVGEIKKIKESRSSVYDDLKQLLVDEEASTSSAEKEKKSEPIVVEEKQLEKQVEKQIECQLEQEIEKQLKREFKQFEKLLESEMKQCEVDPNQTQVKLPLTSSIPSGEEEPLLGRPEFLGRPEEPLGAVGGGDDVMPSAPSMIAIPCSICKETIHSTSDMKGMLTHLEDKHNQRCCPVCSTMYDLNMPGARQYFAWHVETHFDPAAPRPPVMYP